MKNSSLKKRIFTVLIILLVFFSVGCQQSEEVAYDNFITDLDVLYRFEDIAFNVEFGRYSNTFQTDIRYLIADLNTFDIDSDRAKLINDQFIQCAKDFLSASQHYFEDRNDIAEVYLEAAKSEYFDAINAYYDFIVQ